MLLTALSLALASAPPGLPATVRPPCGTPSVLPSLGPAPRLPVAPPSPSSEKEARDAYGSLPNTLAGENFVIKWGSRGGVAEDDVEALLDAFEFAWTEEIEGLDFPAPGGTDRFLFNVYIGDTGDGAPDGYGTSGYYNRDSQGYPMIVVSAATLEDRSWAKGTAAHEFFHAVQDATGRFGYEGDSAWYWEATAMWIEGEVLANYDEYVAFLYGYALLPHLPVYFFDYPDTGALQEYHQYGAMIFPRYVSEIAADADLVRDSWVLDLGADTPQDALTELLADRGIAFADAFGDFAARNATWDYADGDLYTEWVNWYAAYFRGEDHRVVDTLGIDGTDGLMDAPEDTLPQRYGYNVVTLERTDTADYVVSVEVAEEGSRGSEADWRVTVVQELAGGPRYTLVPITDGAGEVRIAGTDGAALHLIAAAVPEDARSDESFAWSYAISAEVPAEPDDTGTDRPVAETPDDTVEVGGGCGCGTGGSAWLGGALLGVALVAARRRR